MATFLYRLGHFCVRRRRFVVLFWLVALGGVIVAGLTVGGETTSSVSLGTT